MTAHSSLTIPRLQNPDLRYRDPCALGGGSTWTDNARQCRGPARRSPAPLTHSLLTLATALLGAFVLLQAVFIVIIVAIRGLRIAVVRVVLSLCRIELIQQLLPRRPRTSTGNL